ncbi:MAG TPA: MarR family winged helix-turn-helix transcriptional regulator [Caldilineaceae bacterium]|nr:MarR family winged helix-turn-helix transcriptional regulator [Caldilineaceae bacterium]
MADQSEEKADLAEMWVRLEEAWARVSRQISAELNTQYAAVPAGQALLLQLLDAFGPQRMSDLATLLGMSHGGCTLLVHRAQAAALVKRVRDGADRRVVWVEMDGQGEALLAEMRRARAQIIAHYITQLDPSVVKTLAELLERITLAFSKAPER